MPSSGYTAITFVAGEQPTTAKWNLIGSNDASFNTGLGFNDDIILARHIADDQVDHTHMNWDGTNGKVWWEEIGRNTLSIASDTMSVSGMTGRKHLRVLIWQQASGGTIDSFITFNGDTGANYAQKYQVAMNGTVTDAASGTNCPLESGQVASGGSAFTVLDIVNIASREKHFKMDNQHAATGAATVPTVIYHRGKWVNTSAQITQITVTNTGGTGDMQAGSEIVVLGHD